MPNTLTVYAKDLDPWRPDLDARRSDKAQIISGTNFVDDVDGPRSAFASSFYDFNFWDLATRGKVNQLKAGLEILYGTQTGVWRINPTTLLAEPLLLVTTTKKFWPWTIAYVGGFYYLAQYDIGLWQYDPVAQTIHHIVTPASDVIRGVAVSFGRLLAITDTAVGITALDDGTNFTPSLSTAAQAQAISLISGVALKLEPTADGWMLHTTNGIMKATYTIQAYVFEYRALTTHIKLTSPNASVYVPHLGVISLDPSGLHLRPTDTDPWTVPTVWEAEKSDYIRKNILNTLNANLYGTIDLFWSEIEQKLFISFSGNSPEGVMNICFVWTMISGRWSSFDIQHTGIFEVYSAVNNTYTCAYMGIDGFIHQFNNSDSTDTIPTTPYNLQDYVYRPQIGQTTELGIYNQINSAGVQYDLGTTEINGSDNIPTAYRNFVTSMGYYINYTPYSDTHNDTQDDPAMTVGATIVGGTYINMDTSGGVELYAFGRVPDQIGTNSVIKIGPFRFSDQVQADETSALSSLIIGIANLTSFSITEDWNLLQGSEDWNSLTGQEDWNLGNADPNVFALTLTDSNDGVNPIFTGDEELQVFSNLGASLVYQNLGYSSIYHLLTLSANDPGEAFALKFVEFSGLNTGRLLYS